jgi:uncharacterized protein (DUF342 family)
MITHSLDWVSKRSTLQEQLSALPFNPDLRKMLRNIDTMVETLSKAEVAARRNKKPTNTLDELKKVNESIVLLEQWIMMATLCL